MSPPLLIMTTEDVFQLEGRGTLVTGMFNPNEALPRRGVSIELHTPAHTRFSNSIADIERFLKGRLTMEPPNVIGLLLAIPIPSDQLPRGTKVYYAGEVPAT